MDHNNKTLLGVPSFGLSINEAQNLSNQFNFVTDWVESEYDFAGTVRHEQVIEKKIGQTWQSCLKVSLIKV